MELSLHHLMSGWGDFPGGTPSWEEHLRILNDGLLAQRTVYAAYRKYRTLVVGEVVRQQAFFEHHAQADATGGRERHGGDYAAHPAQIQTEQLQHLAVDNSRQFERYATDYREWRLQCPGRRAVPPDTMTQVDRAARCAACMERHSMVRLPCRMGPGGRCEVPFHSGTASPPRSAARMAAREAASTQQQPRQALAEFEAAARAAIQGVGRLVRTGAQRTDYAGGAPEAPQRHTTATPAPAARPVATPVAPTRVPETPVRADATRTVTIRTPTPHEATGRMPWPGVARRPAPGEPGWPGPPPNYVPRPMSEHELARERLALLTETTRATTTTTRQQHLPQYRPA
jgi:hypothetical protein